MYKLYGEQDTSDENSSKCPIPSSLLPDPIKRETLNTHKIC